MLGIPFQFIYLGPRTLKYFKPCSAWHSLKCTYHYKYAVQISFNKYKSIKRFLLLDFHRYGCGFYFSAYSMHTVYDSCWVSKNLEGYSKVNIVNK